jgi:hypothetical protein
MKAQQSLKTATKIDNGDDDWFMTILYHELPRDNNEAEKSLKSIVVIRKIIECLRSNLSIRNCEVMMSLISQISVKF